MVGIALEGKGGGGVACQGLQVADGLATLSQQRQAAVPEVVEADRGRPARLRSGL